MEHAHAIDAVCKRTFYFKKDLESRKGRYNSLYHIILITVLCWTCYVTFLTFAIIMQCNCGMKTCNVNLDSRINELTSKLQFVRITVFFKLVGFCILIFLYFSILYFCGLYYCIFCIFVFLYFCVFVFFSNIPIFDCSTVQTNTSLRRQVPVSMQIFITCLGDFKIRQS